MKKLLFFTCLFISINIFSQKKADIGDLAYFPSDYLGQTLTFTNVLWWPQLVEATDRVSKITYYRVDLNISGEVENREWKFGSMDNIGGVTSKIIAKKLSNEGLKGYDTVYLGDVTGKVVKASIFGNKYFFLISKIVYKNNAGEVIKVYTN